MNNIVNFTGINFCDPEDFTLPAPDEVLSGFQKPDLSGIFSPDYETNLQKFIGSLPSTEEITTICRESIGSVTDDDIEQILNGSLLKIFDHLR